MAIARAVVTLLIAVALAYLLISFSVDVQSETPPGAVCSVNPDDDEEVRRKMERGFDQAFQQQIASLFKVYTQNAPSVEQQRAYTKTGMENAIAAWRVAMEAVEGWCK